MLAAEHQADVVAPGAHEILNRDSFRQVECAPAGINGTGAEVACACFATPAEASSSSLDVQTEARPFCE